MRQSVPAQNVGRSGMTHSRSYRWAGAAVTATALFATALAAQPPRPGAPVDPIEAAKANQQIIEQKMAVNVLQTIENADRLARGGHTAKAVQQLKTMKQDVQLALGIGDATRTKFTAQ